MYCRNCGKREDKHEDVYPAVSKLLGALESISWKVKNSNTNGVLDNLVACCEKPDIYWVYPREVKQKKEEKKEMKINVSLKTVYEAKPCKEEWDEFHKWAIGIPYQWEEQLGESQLGNIKKNYPTWYRFFVEKGLVVERPEKKKVDWSKFTIKREANCVNVLYGDWYILEITNQGVKSCYSIQEPELENMLNADNQIKIKI